MTRRHGAHVREEATDGRSRGDVAIGSTPIMIGAFTLFLALFGLVMSLSASTVYSLQSTGSAFTVFSRQAIWVLVGVAAMVFTASVDYRLWRRFAMPLLAVASLLCLAVLIPGLGKTVYGSTRWIGVGSFRMQPSELAKVAVVLAAALVLERKYTLLDDPVHLLVPVVAPLFLGVAMLIMLEPDFGTTLIIAAIVAYMLFLAGARLRHMFNMAAAAVVLAALLSIVADYRRKRMLTFLDPWKDKSGAGYQVVQSLIAIGSGGPTGLGLGASRQKWMFLPNAHTDFIFSVIGEELGLVGCLVVLLLLFGLVLFCARAANRAPDMFGTLVAGGVAVWLGVQAVLNLGAVTSLLPVDGVPLPLISVGGSNACVLMAALGIVISVGRAGDIEVQRRARRTRKWEESTTDLRRFLWR